MVGIGKTISPENIELQFKLFAKHMAYYSMVIAGVFTGYSKRVFLPIEPVL